MSLAKLSRLLPSLLLGASLASGASVSIDVSHPGADINPAMWGVFFEDINLGADGGLYAELVKNRAFEFPVPLMGWSVPAENAGLTRVVVSEDSAANARPGKFATLSGAGAGASLDNEGFRGIGIHANDTYEFSVLLRGATGTSLRVELLRQGGATLASAVLNVSSTEWKEYQVRLEPKATDSHARLRLTLQAPGSVDLTRVSLFPSKTWKDRPKGLRADMVQALADLGPGFLRFPGGCIVEGPKLAQRYQWKKTLGPVNERELLFNRWNTEFKHRSAPDYFQSFGLGFLEYFQLCEDLNAEPLPILNCGMACQYNSGELAAMDSLEAYIQDALDLVEFANGDVTTPWGAKRAALGHPKPFNLKLLGVGNEQWGSQYVERFKVFAEALHKAHPGVALIAAAGPSPDGESFDLAWKQLPAAKADIIDEHCYADSEWFFNNAARFDHYDRKGPKVFMGEYAARGPETANPEERNSFKAALSEAAYLTGLERNADVVRMASYAPLFSHIDGWQWTPDLIWVDNLRVVPSVNYYVQQLYARNRGDRVLPVAVKPANDAEAKRFYASSTWDEGTQEVIVKIVNATGIAGKTDVHLTAPVKILSANLTRLESASLEASNSFADSKRVTPKQESLPTPVGNSLSIDLPAHAFAVLRLKIERL